MKDHHTWHQLLTAEAADHAYCTTLIDCSAPGAGDWLRALPSALPTTFLATDFRTALQRRLRLPVCGLDPSTHADAYGDAAANSGHHTPRHHALLDVWEVMESRAHGADRSHREPDAYAAASPAHKPDILNDATAD